MVGRDRDRIWRAVAGVLVGCLLVMGAVEVGLRISPTALLPALPDAAAVQVSRHATGGIPPLSADFIAQVLGRPEPGSADAGVSEAGVSRSDAPAEATVSPRHRARAAAIADMRDRVVVVHPFDNDDRARAFVVTGVPFTARTSAAGATREPDEDSACSPVGGTVWYRYTADRDRRLAASTFGSASSTALGVFRETRQGRARRMVGCDVDAAGNAEVAFAAKRGRSYLFQISRPAGGGAAVLFHLDALGVTWRASTDSRGRESDDGSSAPALSADGRFVAFRSDARLIDADRQDRPGGAGTGNRDVYVTDLASGAVELVSVSSDEQQADRFSDTPAISGDGRFVAFSSPASNLVPGDTNGYEDVFVRDRLTGSTVRASVSSSGDQGEVPLSHVPAHDVGHFHVEQPAVAMSYDGRYVGFASDLRGLVPGDTGGCSAVGGRDGLPYGPVPNGSVPDDTAPGNRCRDIFVRDLRAGRTVRVSVSSSGEPAAGDSSSTHMSPDGRFVVFASGAPNLVADDGNGYRDVFVHDRDADGDGVLDEPGEVVTTLESRTPQGRPANGNSGGSSHRGHATISADGRFLAFMSDASDLVAGDANRMPDVFLRDRWLGTTRLVSAPQRLGGDDEHSVLEGNAHHSVVSADGRYVTFTAETSHRATGDGYRDVLLYDRLRHRVTRVSAAHDDGAADGNSYEPDISADGRYVAFWSLASNLVAGDTNTCADVIVESATPSRSGSCPDVFVHELATR